MTIDPGFLKKVKSYLRLPETATDDDALLASLIQAAVEQVQLETGTSYNSTADIPGLSTVKIWQLVAHWYNNRGVGN